MTRWANWIEMKGQDRPDEMATRRIMTINLHAPTRRQSPLASGTLFAWAHLPRLALAEGRDPRLLVIVLRRALDGLGGRTGRRP